MSFKTREFGLFNDTRVGIVLLLLHNQRVLRRIVENGVPLRKV